jgi:LmbE family N-acetylglucosaminyl deacetylase
MNSILLAPHNDDETLFASYTLLRHHPHVIICLRDTRHDPLRRELETERALAHLGYEHHTQWTHSNEADLVYLHAALRDDMLDLEREHQPARVYAPATEPGGHMQHTLVGALAISVFGAERVTSYLTYKRGQMRSRSEREVPFEPHWPAFKLRAMSQYVSQISDPMTRPWFTDDTIHEWYE